MKDNIQHSEDSPVFYQYYMFKIALSRLLALKRHHISTRFIINALLQGKNCLRYVAGALFRAVQKKVKQSALPMEEEMLLCMIKLLEEEDGVYDDSIDWIRLVDRGRLNCMSNTTFWLYCMPWKWTSKKTHH